MVWGSQKIWTKVGAIQYSSGCQQARNSVSQTVRNQFTSKINSLKENSAMSSVTKVKSQNNREKSLTSVFDFLTYAREIGFSFSYEEVKGVYQPIAPSDEIDEVSKFDNILSFQKSLGHTVDLV